MPMEWCFGCWPSRCRLPRTPRRAVFEFSGLVSILSWALIGAYAVVTGTVTALGRVSFGVQQATDIRYTIHSLFFCLALVGGGFAYYCARIRNGRPAGRACFLTNVAWLLALAVLCWTA